jgi:benzylsuccinate CoA-transferase BbsF subunit
MGKEVFEGLKVLDFTWAVAGPWTVKYLADHGATVIHLESMKHLDILRTAPPIKGDKPNVNNSFYWANYHNSKLGFRINLKHPQAGKFTAKLISWADVLVENFTPGVMKKWGLSYEEVKRIKPDIVMVSQSQFGQTGPLATMPGTGNQLTAYSSFNYLTGWPDREPCVLYGGFTDCPAARFAAVALIVALLRRQSTGKGMYIDLSQYESGLHLLSPLFLDLQVNGRIALRDGNKLSYAVPHGIYPCFGNDNWCAIAVFNDKQWAGLCKAIGTPAWTKHLKFSTFLKRKKNEKELDRLISQWTANQTPKEAMQKLQKEGVPAGMVQKCEDLYNDPQLKHRGYFEKVEHPVLGESFFESQAFKLSRSPKKFKRPAPLMGEHTEYVCREILQLSDDEFAKLKNEGLFE